MAVGDGQPGSGKEHINLVRIDVDDPGFDHFATIELTHMVVFPMLEGLTRARSMGPRQSHGVRLGRADVVNFDAERAVGQLEQLGEKAKHRVDACVVARRLIPTALVPNDGGAEQFISQSVHVTAREVIVGQQHAASRTRNETKIGRPGEPRSSRFDRGEVGSAERASTPRTARSAFFAGLRASSTAASTSAAATERAACAAPGLWSIHAEMAAPS